MAKKIKNKPFMEQAIELAQRGFSAVEPNPLVGCVIVKAGKVIGQGWHREFGKEHAEINALADCRQKGNDPAGATLCVTLEPCCHHGKTPPCTEAIINAGIEKVIIAMVDPSDKVAGKGIAQLEQAGINVSIGVCENQARLLNPAFIKQARTAVPWVIVKWAQTLDGKLASRSDNPDDRWISNEASRKDVHKLRRSVQAIMVGIGTVAADDPLLTARPDKGRPLLRLVLDSHLRIDAECKLLNTIDAGPVAVITTESACKEHPQTAEMIREKGAEIITVGEDESGRCDLNDVVKALGERDIQRLLVEGGPTLITEFIRRDLADEAIVYVAPKLFGPTGNADICMGLSHLETMPRIFHEEVSLFGTDTKIRGLFRHVSII